MSTYDLEAARYAASKVARLDSLRGKPWYLDAGDAVVWFRADHPDAVIESEILYLHDFTDPTTDETAERAVIRTRITLANGGGASALGQVRYSSVLTGIPKGHHADHIEKAEAKSTRRALEKLGYSLAQLIALGVWTDPGDRQGAQQGNQGANDARGKTNAPRPAQSRIAAPKILADTILADVAAADEGAYVDWRDYVRQTISERSAAKPLYDAAQQDVWRWLVIAREMPTAKSLHNFASALQHRNITNPTILFEVQSRLDAFAQQETASDAQR